MSRSIGFEFCQTLPTNHNCIIHIHTVVRGVARRHYARCLCMDRLHSRPVTTIDINKHDNMAQVTNNILYDIDLDWHSSFKAYDADNLQHSIQSLLYHWVCCCCCCCCYYYYYYFVLSLYF